ncbi:hypothetical protein BC827DRAFT_1259717 [Russula dissimulans]|nr:hypothetical protein BC827DRAFT_1259717 [Russula dissimulans]
MTAIGDDLALLEKELGAKEYETKTTRHEAPSRLAGRGAYAIVNNDPRVPSQRSTHLGYCVSHPSEPGEPQKPLGLHPSSSFMIQRAKYPDWILDKISGRGRGKGREDCGLRFAPVEGIEFLEYEGAELLLIAARVGEELGNQETDNKAAPRHTKKKESKGSVDEVSRGLATDSARFPAEPLTGLWIRYDFVGINLWHGSYVG